MDFIDKMISICNVKDNNNSPPFYDPIENYTESLDSKIAQLFSSLAPITGQAVEPTNNASVPQMPVYLTPIPGQPQIPITPYSFIKQTTPSGVFYQPIFSTPMMPHQPQTLSMSQQLYAVPQQLNTMAFATPQQRSLNVPQGLQIPIYGLPLGEQMNGNPSMMNSNAMANATPEPFKETLQRPTGLLQGSSKYNVSPEEQMNELHRIINSGILPPTLGIMLQLSLMGSQNMAMPIYNYLPKSPIIDISNQWIPIPEQINNILQNLMQLFALQPHIGKLLLRLMKTGQILYGRLQPLNNINPPIPMMNEEVPEQPPFAYQPIRLPHELICMSYKDIPIPRDVYFFTIEVALVLLSQENFIYATAQRVIKYQIDADLFFDPSLFLMSRRRFMRYEIDRCIEEGDGSAEAWTQASQIMQTICINNFHAGLCFPLYDKALSNEELKKRIMEIFHLGLFNPYGDLLGQLKNRLTEYIQRPREVPINLLIAQKLLIIALDINWDVTHKNEILLSIVDDISKMCIQLEKKYMKIIYDDLYMVINRNKIVTKTYTNIITPRRPYYEEVFIKHVVGLYTSLNADLEFIALVLREQSNRSYKIGELSQIIRNNTTRSVIDADVYFLKRASSNAQLFLRATQPPR